MRRSSSQDEEQVQIVNFFGPLFILLVVMGITTTEQTARAVQSFGEVIAMIFPWF